MMPPISYITVAAALVAVVAIGLYSTQMYAIFLFYWAFSVGALLLAFAGVIRIARGTQAPLWVALALVSPFIVWAAERLRDMFAPTPVFMAASVYLSMGAVLALTAAVIGCVRLIEIVSGSSGLTRTAYVILSLSMVIPLISMIQYVAGATWTRSAVYSELMNWLRWPIIVTKYGALIAAAALLVTRRNLEWWTLVPIVGIAAAEAYAVAFPSQFYMGGPFQSYIGVVFWLKPVAYFIAAAAVWRMGSILRAQRSRA